jgi:two-component system, NarL family, response regulator NreC
MGVTVVLADDHPLVREGLTLLLERAGIAVVGKAADGLEAIRLAQRHHPDVMLLDLEMPAMNGLNAVGEIARVSPATKTILLTMHTEEHYTLVALRAGIKGCVWKSQAADQLLQAIRDVCAGGMYLSSIVSGAVVQAYLSKTEFSDAPLTAREQQVLQLVAEGKTTKEIGMILGVATKTAESHRTKLMEKLDIHSAAGLVRYAVRHGVVPP